MPGSLLHQPPTVSNTGPIDGSDTVLIFHKGPDAGRGGNPLKSLIGFEKVFVRAGETHQVKFNVERWMSTQQSGAHTFMVGPTMGYAMHVNTLDGGIVE